MRSRMMMWGAVLTAVFLALGFAVVMGLSEQWVTASMGGKRRALFSLVSYAGAISLAGLLIAQWHRRRAEIVLACVSVVSAILVFDVGARMIDLHVGIPESANMGMFSRAHHHRYPANAKVRLGTVKGERLILQTNEDGFRTRYSRAEFLAKSPRIVILGDSYVFGLGVPQGAEFSETMERTLRAETGNPSLAVLNAGIVGYSPYLERWLYQDVVRHYQPDLVLLMVDATDIGDDLRYEKESISGVERPVFHQDRDEVESFRSYGPAWTILKPLRRAFGLPFEIGRKWLSGSAAETYAYYEFDLEIDGVRETNKFFIYRHPLSSTRRYFDRTLGHIRKLAEQVKADGAEFSVVVIPRFQHWNTKECPNNWEHEKYALNEPHQFAYFDFFREAKADVNFPIFDLLSDFQQTERFPLVIENDPHWNAQGHEFVGEVLSQRLLEAGLAKH